MVQNRWKVHEHWWKYVKKLVKIGAGVWKWVRIGEKCSRMDQNGSRMVENSAKGVKLYEKGLRTVQNRWCWLAGSSREKKYIFGEGNEIMNENMTKSKLK